MRLPFLAAMLCTGILSAQVQFTAGPALDAAIEQAVVEDQIPGDTDRHRIRERPGLTDGEARDFHDETVHGWASPELLRNFRTAVIFLPEVCGSTKLIIR